MSIELPEAKILADQMNNELKGKCIKSYRLARAPVLVGKDAILVGLSNSAFQDIIYRARLHPKRKASELNLEEQKALYNSVKLVLRERLRLNGKDQFFDLYQTKGHYIAAMGPNMRKKKCPVCGSLIEELSLGGGKVFVCSKCQV